MIGARVKTARQRLGFSQSQLAEKAQTTQTTICRIENGFLSHAKLGVVNRVAYALGVSIDSLVRAKTNGNGNVFTSDEKRFLLTFNGLSNGKKRQVKQIVDWLSKS